MEAYLRTVMPRLGLCWGLVGCRLGVWRLSGGSLEALAEECQALAAVVWGLEPEDFQRATNCPPWTLQELVVHIASSIRVGQRPPTAPLGAAPREAADYYRRPERDTAAYRQGNIDRTREQTRAVLAQMTAAQWLEQTIRATMATLGVEDPDRVVVIDRVGPMRMADWVVTRVVSVAAHGLDVALTLSRPPWTTPAALVVIEPVLVSLLRTRPPGQLGWDQLDLLQTGTGRRAPDQHRMPTPRLV